MLVARRRVAEAPVIVGAGPYGLSVAAHLRAAGVPFHLVGEPLESWRSFMPPGMVLKSEPFASNLWDPARRFTFERFCAERRIPYRRIRDPLALVRFLEYADWFRQSAVGALQRDKVRRIRRIGRTFELELASGGALETEQVILATGHMPFCHVPDELSRLPEPLCLHSTRISDPKAFTGRDVTIIGAGQSALETAALLHEAGASVRVLARARAFKWNRTFPPPPHRTVWECIREPEAGLGPGWRSLAVSECPRLFRAVFPPDKRHRYVATSWGPSGAWWLHERVVGRFELLPEHRVRSGEAVGEQVRLHVDNRGGAVELCTDHVIAATGFRIDIERLEILDPALRSQIAREGAAPVLNARSESSVPGLFILGLPSAPTFGPVMRFMFGAKHVAPILARHLRGLRRVA